MQGSKLIGRSSLKATPLGRSLVFCLSLPSWKQKTVRMLADAAGFVRSVYVSSVYLWGEIVTATPLLCH